MPSLWLIVPAWRRYDITRVSFPGLRWCLDTLRDRHGIDGHAIVIGDDQNLHIADQHGFDTLRAPNRPLGRKWNDGYQCAAEAGADYLVPCGTDDWLDPDYLAQLPKPTEIRASRWSTAIREDGRKLYQLNVDYEGGDGIRIIPRGLLERCRFRPADEHRDRAIDTSVWRTLQRTSRGFRFVYSDDPLAIVQFQSVTPQLNQYAALRRRFEGRELDRPFDVLRADGRYPAELINMAERRYR